MWHYVAKLGRKPIAKYVIPASSVGFIGAYAGVHTVGQSLVCNLLAAKSDEGYGRQEFTDELKTLIRTVYAQLKGLDFAKGTAVPGDEHFNKEFKSDLKIKWFVSSTLEPINLGMSEFRTGIMIGVPSHYNYVEPSDVPDSLFEIHNLKIFKSLFQNQSDKNPTPGQNQSKNFVYINRDVPSGQDYADSFILSDNAKKFSIARELYYADTYRPFITTLVMLFGALFALSLSRSAVQRLHLQDRHVSQRVPFYLVAGFGAIHIFHNLNDMMRNAYTKKSDLRAIAVGEDYRQGAIEYFNKIIKRHKALREQIKSNQSVYDEEGNYKQPFLRIKYTPYTERLAMAVEGPSERLLKKFYLDKSP